ncbi:thiosulfate sulfurtransferase/rhodanese-like domain-containing protein 3 isoform X2 [Syngnathoides biaculeatus]|uniref:thiosulfate sulfurtransferase/rhodanese-like domain-containing protein 3 isoform X2 n=1 Tax=Syngnathoides biaculeatus TaxID=300417 RepID=UPI002ADE900B|nr:thiosulfate sulfurtransferase/rhodanese-like domain-containing protein 3 isoform X2 [Syngnathoides biaculeatus]XP_061676625.1 thiosulfate sulfurtransferase/rhodanese-like domain-containing protein 3 isoform X2 [Syngnathoides biaculeatus]XP_061676626.1 thiosulfate sulfurtransferase/rhodanese-like domain-containing protein 3 isoform X2 [Syngnathoides biaculeatus]
METNASRTKTEPMEKHVHQMNPMLPLTKCCQILYHKIALHINMTHSEGICSILQRCFQVQQETRMALRMCVRFFRVAPRLFWETNVLHSAFVPSGRIRLLGGHNTRLDTTPELWFSCRRFSSVPPSTEVSYKQLKHLLAGGKSLVIDVREPWELREYGSIPGTINVPLGQVNTALQLGPEEFNEKYGGELPQRVDNIVFTCLAGIRSKTALDMASELGYKEVQHYPGGWQDWAKNEHQN